MTQYPDRPTFLLSKGERDAEKGISMDDLEPRYLEAFISRFQYEDLPEGCPLDFPERTMFYHGGLSGKRVSGLGNCLMGAAADSLTLYNRPKGWHPVGITQSSSNTSTDRSLNASSKNPVLWDEIPMCYRIRPYLEVQRKALNAMNQNLAAMCMPVMIETAPGQEVKAKLLRQNLGGGDVFIQTIEKGSLSANVLDLKATDHTQNLIGVVHDMDNTILDMMHIRGCLEKASGISTEEATASNQQIDDGLRMEYEKRKQWVKEINAALGTDIKVHCKLLDTEDDYNEGNNADPGTDSGVQGTEGEE